MPLYITYRTIPEMVPLNKTQRKLVFECAMHAMFAEHPEWIQKSTPWLLAGLGLGLAAGWWVGTSLWPEGPKWLVIGGLAFLGFSIGNLFGNHFFLERLRPYFQRVIVERKSEIARIQ
jgi:uncharacterized membrane protein AbrB (regulator of aidB expression)